MFFRLWLTAPGAMETMAVMEVRTLGATSGL